MTGWYEFAPSGAENVPEFMVDDVRFVQPVGFVWFYKPRYRVKAIGRKMK